VRAVVVPGPGEAASVETLPDPTPNLGEAIVAVRGCGICGTDRHILEEGLLTAKYPLVPGHEPWGEVVAIGPNAEGVKIGDIVAVDPSLHCGKCPRCRRGQGNLCEHWGAIGGTQAGAWAEFVALPAANAHLLPDEYPLDCASLVEPVACALRGLLRLRAEPDRPALIFGGGTMGLLLAILLELRGVGPITIVETNPDRRLLGKSLVDCRFIDPASLGDEEADVVVDATGSEAAIEAALDHVAPGGTFMVFGVASPEARVEYSPFRVYQREITIVGSMAILGTFASAVSVVSHNAERFRPLLTHRFGLDGFNEAIATLSDGRSVKVVIEP
jgi:2-desacetyl-2-hydroxyethyl bacteriochlorophyllide A dehydrogenase